MLDETQTDEKHFKQALIYQVEDCEDNVSHFETRMLNKVYL